MPATCSDMLLDRFRFMAYDFIVDSGLGCASMFGNVRQGDTGKDTT